MNSSFGHPADEVIAEPAPAKDTLGRRELEFELIVDSIPVPVAITTPAGEVRAVNQCTLDCFGRTLEELKAWTTSDVVHADDLRRTVTTQRAAHEASKTGTAVPTICAAGSMCSA